MGYRDADEFKHWKMRDPVAVLRRELAGISTRRAGTARSEVEAEIRSAIAAAKRAESPTFEVIVGRN